MNPVKQTGLSKNATYGIFIIVNVLEKLVKPSVRRAPEGAFRYVRGIMDKPFKTYTDIALI